MRNQKITALAECACMLALAFALSYARLFKMPLGGSVTLASMLPIMLIAVKYGTLVGLGTSFVYSLTQTLQALTEGDVFPYCETATALTVCVLFDYLVPFTVLGLAGLLKQAKLFRSPELSVYVGMFACVNARFLCHYLTGVVIWGQWAPDGMGKFLYSFLYNGSFLSVDFAITLVSAILLFRKKEIKRLVNLI